MRSGVKVQRRRQQSLMIKERRKCRKFRKHSKGRGVNSKAKGQRNMNSKVNRQQQNSKAKRKQRRKTRKRRQKCDALAKRKGRLGFINYGPGSTWGWIGYPVGQGARLDPPKISLMLLSLNLFFNLFCIYVHRCDDLGVEPLWITLWAAICSFPKEMVQRANASSTTNSQ